MDPQVFDAILGDIAAGEAAHRAMSSHGVPRKAFYALLATDDGAGNRYARAKQAGLEAVADDTMEIADDEALPADSRRIRVDARKWLLSKLAPKKYGDKVTQEHTGEGGGPIQAKVTVEFVGAAAGGVSLPVAKDG
jgi:hypothetical protein